MGLKRDMDMSLDAAKKMTSAAMADSRALNEALFDVKQTQSEAVFIGYREAVSEAMMILLTEILNPAFAKYPSLKPEGFE